MQELFFPLWKLRSIQYNSKLINQTVSMFPRPSLITPPKNTHTQVTRISSLKQKPQLWATYRPIRVAPPLILHIAVYQSINNGRIKNISLLASGCTPQITETFEIRKHRNSKSNHVICIKLISLGKFGKIKVCSYSTENGSFQHNFNHQ